MFPDIPLFYQVQNHVLLWRPWDTCSQLLNLSHNLYFRGRTDLPKDIQQEADPLSSLIGPGPSSSPQWFTWLVNSVLLFSEWLKRFLSVTVNTCFCSTNLVLGFRVLGLGWWKRLKIPVSAECLVLAEEHKWGAGRVKAVWTQWPTVS